MYACKYFRDELGIRCCYSTLQHDFGNKLSFIRSWLVWCSGMTTVVVKKNSGIRQDERIKPAPRRTPCDPFVDFVGIPTLRVHSTNVLDVYMFVCMCVQFLMFRIRFWWFLRGGSIAVSKLSYNKNTLAKCLLG